MSNKAQERKAREARRKAARAAATQRDWQTRRKKPRPAQAKQRVDGGPFEGAKPKTPPLLPPLLAPDASETD